jgi:hypothetical protein
MIIVKLIRLRGEFEPLHAPKLITFSEGQSRD